MVDMSLFLDASVGDILQVGDTQIEVVYKSGRRARLKITGPADVDLVRASRPAAQPQQNLPLEHADGRGS